MSDGTDSGGSTPPGWYPDPQAPGMQRWWDGMAWTDHTAPLATGGPASLGAQGTWGGAAPGGVPASAGGPAGGVAIDTWLWQSIVATVLCCLPLGIAGIVFSSQAQSAINVGNIAEAQQKASQAKTFTLISVALGIVPVGLIILFFVGAGAAVSGY